MAGLKNKKFLLLSLVGLLVLAGGVYLFKTKFSVPAPAAYQIPADWEETQKTLVSGVKIDFKHPPSWSDDLAYCRFSESEKEEDTKCVTVRFLSVDKTRELTKSILGETISIGGKRAVREIKKGEVKIYSVLVFDFFKKPFLGLVAYFTEDENVETLNQILSTFQFVKPKANTLGRVEGELCYSANKIPPGTIIAKDLKTGKIFTLDYPGTEEGGENHYTFELSPAAYYFKYLGYGVSAYYSGTRCVWKDDWGCRKEYHHQLETVKVEAGKTVEMVDLCDFYYTFNQIWASEVGF